MANSRESLMKDIAQHQEATDPQQLPPTGAQHSSGISKALTIAITGGETAMERKSSWRFDLYQGGDFYPVDYNYYSTPWSGVGGVKTHLVTTHAIAYAEDGNDFGADRVYQCTSKRAAHERAMYHYLLYQGLSFARANSFE
eukprot:GHVP01053905.1.p1 GENE.GHVP01053905.1~~GHVP01053905.1.p1  ORF type:complete len:141 (+),score=23.82 GHVP01053905.1:254-676(+)